MLRLDQLEAAGFLHLHLFKAAAKMAIDLTKHRNRARLLAAEAFEAPVLVKSNLGWDFSVD